MLKSIPRASAARQRLGEKVYRAEQAERGRRGGISGLLRTSLAKLAQVQRIGPTRAAVLKASLELGRRLLLQGHSDHY